jgi:hypothetical protein
VATIEELKARINKNPCSPGDLAQTITNITNYSEASGGTILALCTLTNNGVDCGNGTLAVSAFNPLVTAEQEATLVIPTQATNNASYALAVGTSRTGMIAYHPQEDVWYVMWIRHFIKEVLVPTPELSGSTLTFPVETYSVNSCEEPGQVQVTFSTATVEVVTDLDKVDGGPITWDIVEIEVWSATPAGSDSIPTVMRSAIRDIYRENCTIYMQERDLEVFSSEDDPEEYEAVVFDEEVSMLYNIYLDGGYIWGDFLNITVPCTGVESSLPLIPVTDCYGSGSGG